MDTNRKCELQTVVTEDHHEVLPHIYRAIGSKQLPFSGLTLLHFDSHPDLLIPLDMKADEVFLKEKLFETLSIENWIMPAVYAGHIDHVIWVKPPWSDQIEDQQIQFYVGKCVQTGCIRLTCKENYFISEMLRSAEQELENKKLLTLTVITIRPQHWKSATANPRGSSKLENIQATPGAVDMVEGQCENHIEIQVSQSGADNPLHNDSEGSVKKISNTPVSDITVQSCHRTDTEHGEGTLRPECEGSSAESTFEGSAFRFATATWGAGHEECDRGDNSVNDLGTDEASCAHLSSVNCMKCYNNNYIFLASREKSDQENSEIIGSAACADRNVKKVIPDKHDELAELGHVPLKKRKLETANRSLGFTDDSTVYGKFQRDSNGLLMAQVEQLRDGLRVKPFVLDVDLDFFSTLNPFRVMFSEYQFSILRKLFDVPASRKEEDIAECLSKRKEQIKRLKSRLQSAKLVSPNVVNNMGQEEELLGQLIADLERESSRTGQECDYDLVHEAGCTCDDTELPHHKSTDEEVAQLSECMERVLGGLPSPSMITIARSSHDDYCPPDQVNFIEDLVLETLQNLYDNMKINKYYD